MLSLNIKYMSGDIISINVPPNETVGYVKQQLKCMNNNIPIDRIQLFSDVEMYPNEMLLTHYNLEECLSILINPPPPILECFDMYQVDTDVGHTLHRTENSLMVHSIPNAEIYTMLISKVPLPSDCLSFFTIETDVEDIQIEVGTPKWECTHHQLNAKLLNRKREHPEFGDSFFDILYSNINNNGLKIVVMYDPIINRITFFDGDFMNSYDTYHCNQCNVMNHLKLKLFCDLVMEHTTVIRESTREEMERFA